MLNHVTCLGSELTSETMNLFRHVGRFPWTEDQPIARPLSTQYNTTQRKADIHPCV